MSRDGMPKARSYMRAVFQTPAAMADDAAGLLVASGALGCSVAGDNRGAHRRPTLKLEAYFDHLSIARLKAIRRTLAAAGMLVNPGREARCWRIVDPGWATSWMERFEPVAVGRLLIVPPWSSADAVGRTRLVINPGQAFGTGHHPTTYGALMVIGELCGRRKLSHGLDVGTGSGILAIAMRLLGVRRVTAVDVDAAALDNARENAALNSLGASIKFSATAIHRFRRRFDLMVANILSSTLGEIADSLKRLLAPEGYLILGGILNREAPAILSAYGPQLRCVRMRRDRGWTTLVLAR